VSFRLAEDQLFDQPVEEFADKFRPPAIEAKCIFVEIPLKVFARHSALVCRPQPAFDERNDQVNMRETASYRRTSGIKCGGAFYGGI
jgi:hypothetical protein